MFAPAEGLPALVFATLLLGWASDTVPRYAPAEAAAAHEPAAEPAPDTIHLEVGSREVDGSVYPPHRARNRVYIGDSPEVVSTWVNELTLGDSAGIPVMRWSSKSEALEPGDRRSWCSPR